jgi:hypothetical protein
LRGGNGEEHKYDYLIVSGGLKLNWEKIINAREALEND